MQTVTSPAPTNRPDARGVPESHRLGRWLDHFRRNSARAPNRPGDDVTVLAPALRAALGGSLGRFYLGEAGEGRIVHEVAATSDPAFGPEEAEAVVLYIREEWRHAAELRGILTRLGAEPAKRTLSEMAFRRGRRLMGLRLKLLTIGAAEVAGIAYYSLLAERIGAPSIAAITSQIAREERAHLDFVRELLARAATEHPLVGAEVDRLVVQATFAAVALCGALAVSAEHGELLQMLGSSRAAFVARCLDVLRA
jgi:hypothetical protein